MSLDDLKMETLVATNGVCWDDVVKVIDHLHGQGRIVTDGYTMVPLEPTHEMTANLVPAGGDRSYIVNIYKTMIAAVQKGDVGCLKD